MTNRYLNLKSLTLSLLITGNLIGAGILALPINTGIAGLYPALLVMILMGIGMYYTAISVADEVSLTKNPLFNFASFYRINFGKSGQIVAVFMNLLILYGFLTAYLTGISAMAINIFHLTLPREIIVVLTFVVMTSLSFGGAKVLARYNFFLMLIILFSFALLIFLSLPAINPSFHLHKNWAYLPATGPVVLAAYYFHNIIPTICKELDWKKRAIHPVIFMGIMTGLLMCFAWVFVATGILPFSEGPHSIVGAFEGNLPATIPMAGIIGNKSFITISLIFSVLAIITSYLANGLGLVELYNDLTVNYWNIKSRPVVYLLSFLPPLIISLFFPDIFIKVIDIVGGIGICILFGIFPALVSYRKGRELKKKIFPLFFMIIFTLLLFTELSQDVGIIKIDASYESWEIPFLQKFYHPVASHTSP